MLRGVLRAVKTCNLSIPRDISGIGTTDSDLSELMVPAITVVQVDYYNEASRRPSCCSTV